MRVPLCEMQKLIPSGKAGIFDRFAPNDGERVSG